ncbi:hypothetical protein OS493_006747 [Desmophyllum pertusum]|uniref:Uncharacterized protein n=1 Tax=Desmophyllum pertusum TaxID=174260 RepID=A0A9W9ZTA2_9CNID|nr:hypothetical protein OS493_006747 [Desmophyllum pertusum]
MAWNLSINFRRRDSEKPKEVSCVTEELQKWSEEFKVEETRAIHSLGKYRLAPVYDQFQIDPTRWNYWSPERQVQHVNSFREFLPKSYDSYTKPTSAGHKTSKSTKRRADLPEPEIFADRIPNVNPPLKKTALTPLRLSTVGESSQWQSILYISVTGNANFRMTQTTFTMVGFTQPQAALPVIQDQQNNSKGFTSRFLWLFPEPVFCRMRDSTLTPSQRI